MTVTFDPEVTAEEFRGRRVTIIGLGKGRTTAGLARFLVRKGANVTIADPKPREDLVDGIARLGDVAEQVTLILGPSTDETALAEPDFVFVIPGIRPRSPTILRALSRGVPVLTEMALFFRLCPATIVGITGTKGKTTTTTLVERILTPGSRKVLVGGNIGTAIIQEVESLRREDIVVLELSSFQLETLGHSPQVAVVTNVLEDHIDHHGTRDAYIAAKKNIVAWQGPRDIAVLNLDDPSTVALHTGAAFDIPPDVIGRVLREFEGVPRRLETIAERDGVLWVNDSAATTPAATMSALAAYERPAVAILGGVSKGADFSELARVLALRAHGAVLIGRAADEIASAIAAADKKGAIEVRRAATLDEAVADARAMARPGDVVLLSPACASFDMFSSADERGEKFTAIVRSFAS